MAVSEYHARTGLTVGATEQSLSSDNTGPQVQVDDGLYQTFLDLNALAAGDVFEWLLYEKIRAGGAQVKCDNARPSGVQGVPIWFSPFDIILLHGWDLTFGKISGTDRSIDSSVRRITGVSQYHERVGLSVGSTEQSLSEDNTGPQAQTDNVEVQCWIDLSNLAGDDVFEWRAYEEAAGGTQRLFASKIFTGPQTIPGWYSPLYTGLHGWDFTLEKTGGVDATDRSVDSSVRTRDAVGGVVIPVGGFGGMKSQFVSGEVLRITIPPFVDRTTGVLINAGTDVITLVIQKPDDTLLAGPPVPAWDSDINMWLATVPVVSFLEGEWLILASTNDANGNDQHMALTWGDYVDDIPETRQATLGRWRIIGTQLLLYEEDNLTIFRTFDLKDAAGAPSAISVFERDPV